TDDAPDETVVIRMRSRAQTLVQSRVELVFVWLRCSSIRYLKPKPSEPGCRDQHEQGTIALPAFRQNGQARFDEFFARQGWIGWSRIHRLIPARKSSTFLLNCCGSSAGYRSNPCSICVNRVFSSSAVT